ncbi:Tetrapyrrole methylase [Corchorus olitorius]|uniref:Annexin n=1 Tax=Corchorus olitorius TaxID=93759 RepID=A0A1R3G0W0_9ROSI|nr:Tetrapyrrole methylase [Corchorus olitorius]
MLYIIGLGLGDEKDITLKGLDAVKRCEKVYIESYTSLLSFGISSDGLSTLERLYGKPITVADREMVEEKADSFLSEARGSDVAFLVVGDPFGATTHTDLVVRANTLGVDVKVVHNASVMNAIGICGLQLYRYGETVSIPFFTESWRPDSFYEKIQRNRNLGLHTLCLLDIRVKEPTLESLCRGRKQYEPPRFMTINTAIEQLLEVEQKLGESVYDENTYCVGFARLGSEDQMIVAGTMRQLQMVDFGKPLHCLVIVGWGTDENAIVSILGHRNLFQRKLIRLAFEEIYHQDLLEQLKCELSGDFERAVSLWTLDPADRDAVLAHEALQKCVADYKVIVEIACVRSPEDLLAVKRAYKFRYKHSLEEDLASYTSGNIRKGLSGGPTTDHDYFSALRTVIRCIRDPKKYFAKVLRAAINMPGTDEDALTRVIITRAEKDLKEIKELYLKRNNVTLHEAVARDISGDYKAFLLALLGAEEN